MNNSNNYNNFGEPDYLNNSSVTQDKRQPQKPRKKSGAAGKFFKFLLIAGCLAAMVWLGCTFLLPGSGTGKLKIEETPDPEIQAAMVNADAKEFAKYLTDNNKTIKNVEQAYDALELIFNMRKICAKKDHPYNTSYGSAAQVILNKIKCLTEEEKKPALEAVTFQNGLEKAARYEDAIEEWQTCTVNEDALNFLKACELLQQEKLTEGAAILSDYARKNPHDEETLVELFHSIISGQNGSGFAYSLDCAKAEGMIRGIGYNMAVPIQDWIENHEWGVEGQLEFIPQLTKADENLLKANVSTPHENKILALIHVTDFEDQARQLKLDYHVMGSLPQKYWPENIDDVQYVIVTEYSQYEDWIAGGVKQLGGSAKIQVYDLENFGNVAAQSYTVKTGTPGTYLKTGNSVTYKFYGYPSVDTIMKETLSELFIYIENN